MLCVYAINALMWRSDKMLSARAHVFSQSVLMNYPYAAVALPCAMCVGHSCVQGNLSHQCVVALTTSDNAASGSWLDSEDTGVSSTSDSDKEAAVNIVSAPSWSPDTILQQLSNDTYVHICLYL